MPTMSRDYRQSHTKQIAASQLKWRKKNKKQISAYRAALRQAKRDSRLIIGIDGEGYTLADGSHRYTYLAACTADKLVADVSNREGLTFREVADFLCDLPPALIVGFSLGYDRTKWIEDLPDRAIYALLRPEERVTTKGGSRAIRCKGFKVNLISSRFSITREGDDTTATVWDLFKFFQCSFVKALTNWSVGSKKQITRIAAMKRKRGVFRGIGKRERDYCQEECRLLARLAGELIDAHEQEGLTLPHFYGPGSTAGVILAQCAADEQRAELPGRMKHAVASAYFGGRFEDSHVGPIRKKVYAYDIASAYPYAISQLPCLRPECGKWRHTKKIGKVKSIPHAGELLPILYRYRIDPHPKACKAWGPLPHRLPDGNIVFPLVSEGGWAWHAELTMGMKLHPGVTPLEAWVWEPNRRCDHVPPFASKVADLFCRRLSWGKAARGIVLKLGLNSMYGKSAQRIGSGKYRCFVRAGLITSYTRAMLLGAILAAKDPWDVLELATDSVLSTKPLKLPKPLTLGTEDAAKKASKSPLGAWEEKQWDDAGVFLIRPGLRFPIAHDAEPSYTAARGVGTRIVHENRKRILAAWEREPMAVVTVQQPSMFHGAKLCVRRNADGTYVRDALYGRWTTPEPRNVSYAPVPKRCAIEAGRLGKDSFRLTCWELPQGPGCESMPFGAVDEEHKSELAQTLEEMREREREQPEAETLRVV